jgi:hypothetical protein
MLPPIRSPSPIPLSPADEPRVCGNCGRSYPKKEVDGAGWCVRCRAELVRRSARVARLVAFVFTLGLATAIYSRTSGSNFMMMYVVAVAATYFLVARITQRVAFEVFRARGVHSPSVKG